MERTAACQGLETYLNDEVAVMVGVEVVVEVELVVEVMRGETSDDGRRWWRQC
jgi:hypothetical protein